MPDPVKATSPKDRRSGLRRRLYRWWRELVYTWGLIVGFTAPDPLKDDEEDKTVR